MKMNTAGKKYLAWLDKNKDTESYKEYQFWIDGGNSVETCKNFYNDITILDFSYLFFANETDRNSYLIS